MKNHVYEVFNTTTNHVPELDQNISETVKFNFKTGIPELDKVLNDLGNTFWEQIIFMMKANREYYECLTQIIDTRKFQNYRDVRIYVSSKLKNIDRLGYVESDLTPAFKAHLEKFTNMLDTELNEELPKLKFLSYRAKVNALRNELEEIKRNTKITEFNIKLLHKEKKDLMNILESYNTENLHKVPLEKRLKSEQEKHVELQAMVSAIFKNKIPFCTSQIGKSSHSVCRSETSDLF